MKVSLSKSDIISFSWQHLWLIASLYVMTLGIALCVRSNLGSSVISVLPFVFTSAGKEGLVLPWTIGQYTYIMNIVLVFGQIAVLRSDFEWIQLFQLLVGFIFGSFIDVNMFITGLFLPANIDVLWMQILVQVLGCTVLGTGIAFEVKCGSVTMPGEGFPVAIARKTGKEFPKVKIMVDISLVILGIIAGFCFFGEWRWNIIGIGTLFAMVYVGWTVKMVTRHIGWFGRLLAYQPGFRRYIYGLARYIKQYND